MTIRTNSATETQNLGRQIAKEISGGGVICFRGLLGAGKTTMIQGIAAGLGVKDRIISPTFILMRRYQTKDKNYLYHIDLYRLNSLEEVKALGIEEFISDPANILLIEWPEKIEPILPKTRWEINLEAGSENERKITITKIS